MKNSITITYKEVTYTKEVIVKSKEGNVLHGRVGTATFYWERDKYKAPLVRFRNPNTIDYRAASTYSHLIRLFIEEYLFMKNGKSPMHFEESTYHASPSVQEVVTQTSSSHTSGVPLWMKDDHKVWTECFKRDGSSYMRRTRYKKESKEVVEKYLPHCSGCPFRSTCLKPCEDPLSASTSKELQTV